MHTFGFLLLGLFVSEKVVSVRCSCQFLLLLGTSSVDKFHFAITSKYILKIIALLSNHGHSQINSAKTINKINFCYADQTGH